MDTRQYALSGKGCMNQSPCKFLFIMAGEHAANSYNIHKNKLKTIKKMEIGMYILIITLNVNGLNAPIKRHRLAGYKNKTQIYAVYKRPTSDLGTYTD